MTIRYEQSPDNHIVVLDGRKNWSVDCAAYVYDIWYPLFGMDPIGVYNLLCRLARDGSVSQLGIKKFAEHCRIGKVKWLTLTNTLCECGFIQINVPHWDQREQGISTVYVVLDAPKEITPELFNKYVGDDPKLYRPITHWFFERPVYETPDDAYPQVIDEDDDVGGGSIQNQGWFYVEPGVVPDRTLSLLPVFDPSVEKSSLNPLDANLSDDALVERIPEDDDPLAEDSGTGTVKHIQANAASWPGKSLEDYRNDVADHQCRVAGAKTGRGEERGTAFVSAGKTKVKIDDPHFPAIGRLVIDLVLNNFGKANRELSQEQIAALTTLPVATKAGQKYKFTVADLYEQYPNEFAQWMSGLPKVIMEDHKKRMIVKNVIDYLRGYDWYGIGFESYLNACGFFPGGPVVPQPQRDQPKELS